MDDVTTGARSSLGLSNAHIPTPGYLPCVYSPRGRFLQLSKPEPGTMPCRGVSRGVVSEFSRQSRKRMMQYFASIDEESVSRDTTFVTLTYHNEWGDDAHDWHADLNVFLQWLMRRYPRCGVVWRLEFQERGAPHWHLLIVGARHIPWQDITEEWRSIAHQNSVYRGQYATKVEGIKSWRQACFYLGKYVAKVNDCPMRVTTGRCWGVRRPEMIPTSLKVELLPIASWRVVYSAMLAMMPEPVRAIYTRYPARGIWSMLSRFVVDDLLNYALGRMAVTGPDS